MVRNRGHKSPMEGYVNEASHLLSYCYQFSSDEERATWWALFKTVADLKYNRIDVKDVKVMVKGEEVKEPRNEEVKEK